MEQGWVGRKLMLASRALASRYAEHQHAAGALGPAVAEVAGSLLREIGRCLALSETGAYLPFARARGVLRLPVEESVPAVSQAYSALAKLAAEYLTHLPGATDEDRNFAKQAITHAARATLRLQRHLAQGGRDHDLERLFGGVAVLSYPAQGMVAP